MLTHWLKAHWKHIESLHVIACSFTLASSLLPSLCNGMSWLLGFLLLWIDWSVDTPVSWRVAACPERLCRVRLVKKSWNSKLTVDEFLQEWFFDEFQEWRWQINYAFVFFSLLIFIYVLAQFISVVLVPPSDYFLPNCTRLCVLTVFYGMLLHFLMSWNRYWASTVVAYRLWTAYGG